MDVAVANQDSEKLMLVKMENILMHLEELDQESSIGCRRFSDKGQNTSSGSQIKCDSTVPEEPPIVDQQSWSLPPPVEGSDFGSRGTMVGTLSSQGGHVATNSVSLPISENSQWQSQAGDSSEASIERLKAELESLRADLWRSDNTVLLLKRHIELNTATGGTASSSFSPDVIVALVQEVERLNAELEKVAAESRSNEHIQGNVPGTEPDFGQEPFREIGGEVRSLSLLSVQSLDSTLTGGSAVVAVDHSMRQRCASVSDLQQLRDKQGDELLTKDSLFQCDLAAAGDATAATSVKPLSANSVGNHTSFVGSPAGRNILRQSIAFSHSPFQSASAANQRAFAELQAEVERLRHRLELTELENSRLLEHSTRDSVVPAVGRPSLGLQAELSVSIDGSLVKCSASGDVTVAAGFLKKLVTVSIAVFCLLILMS